MMRPAAIATVASVFSFVAADRVGRIDHLISQDSVSSR